MKEFYTAFNVLKRTFFIVIFTFCIFQLFGNGPIVPLKKADLTIEIHKLDISCYGELDGKAWVTASGGTPPYTYLWSDGAITDTVTNLSSNTYTINVEDAAGNKVVGEVYIAEPSLLFATVLLSDPILNCSVPQLTATIQPNGGTQPYTYAWNYPYGVIDTGQTVNINQPYNYVFTVTDKRGCTYVNDTTIGAENIPVINLSLIDTVSCNGKHDGSASSLVFGGIEPYFYLWSNGSSNDTLKNVGSGSFSLTVTDAAGCTGQAYVFIPQPASLSLDMTGYDVTCYGQSTGAIFTFTGGGTPNYQYLWSNGATIPQLSNLDAGVYNLTVTDAHGCTKSGGVTIKEGNPITINTTATPVSCYGGNNGRATAFAFGGKGSLQYNWSNGVTGAQNNNLKAGSYWIYITDANNCVESKLVEITQPPAIILNMSSTPEVLGGVDGTASVIPTGGTPGYTYKWNTGSTESHIEDLVAGIYYVTVTDKNGCIKSDSVYVDASNCAFAATLITIKPTCFGGTDGAIFPQITLPGAEPYYYQWSNNSTDVVLDSIGAGTYAVTISDNANCFIRLSTTIVNPDRMNVDYIVTQPTGPDQPTGSIKLFINGGSPPYKAIYNGATLPGGNEITVSDIPSGYQQIEVKDAKGCTFPIEFQIDQFDCQMTASVVVTDEPDCYGDKTGSMCVMYDNNFGNVTIEWSNGAKTSCINSLKAGNYTVALRDTLGCTVVAGGEITEPNPISLDNIKIILGTNSLDGSISLYVIGGTPPFQYTWTKNGEYFANTRDIYQLNGGLYQLHVVDSKGCETTFEAFKITPTSSTLSISPNIKVYPNPVKDYLILENKSGSEIMQIQCFDLSGEKRILSIEPFEEHSRLNLREISTGPVFLNVVTRDGSYNIKLIKVE